jgi:hemerythrin-like metal-binding protein/PAS domain S-box-containing protein
MNIEPQKKIVLIIDDNATNIGVLIETLKIHGFETVTARRGAMGIRRAQFSKPDLILLDIKMPEMDGYEVCKHLKADEQTQHIPVIFISALTETFDKVKAFSVGGIDYVTKPFEEIEVLARINTHLSIHNLQKQLTAQNAQLQHEIANCERMKRALRESEKQFQGYFDSALVGLTITSLEKGWIYANTSICEMLGYSLEELKNLSWAELTYPDDLAADVEQFEQLLAGKIDGYTIDKRFIRKDSTILYAFISVTARYKTDGSIDQIVATLQDITERKQAEKKLYQQNEQLKIQNEQLDAFATQLEKLQREKLYQLNQAYERFVPHQFLSLLGKESIIDINLGDQVEQEMTILFSDIRGFTSISEKMTPQDNFDFLNTYVGQMEPIIHQYQGIIDKYIGDAIMALFPLSAEDAINSAIAMLKKLVEYNKILQTANLPKVQIGIGIHTGSMMLGTIGGQNRMDTTVISDAVNIASRLESLTKTYGNPLLISEATYLKLSDISKYHIRLLDRVKVKGKSESVKIFEVFTADPQKMLTGKLATLNQFEKAVHLYQQQNFSKAQELFQACLSQNPDDATAEIYVQHCQQFLNANTNTRWEEIAATVKWTPILSVHHDLIDQQHQELFTRIRDLIMSFCDKESDLEVGKTIDFLKKYVVVHFNTEEQLMQQHNYSDYLVHKAQHTRFLQRFAEIEKDYKAKGGYLYLTLQIQEELVNWLINHIAKSDKKLGVFLTEPS